MAQLGGDNAACKTEQWHLVVRRLGRSFYSLYWTREPAPLLLPFRRDVTMHMWAALARPLSPARTGGSSVAAHVSAPGPARLAAIEALPAELLRMILGSSLLCKTDVVALGLASPQLWPHALEKARSHGLTAPLARRKLAVTGGWLRESLMFYTAEPAEPVLAVASVGSQSHDWSPPCSPDRISFEHWPDDAAVKAFCQLARRPEAAWARAWTRWKASLVQRAGCGLAEILEMQLAQAAAGVDRVATSPNSPYVLRNLDTKEFVRCRPGTGVLSRLSTAWRGRDISVDGELIRHWGIVDQQGPAVRVDDVLLLRAFWSHVAYELNSEDLLLRPHFKGDWAGCRFDILPLGAGAVDGEWRDCTTAVAEEARKWARQQRRSSEGTYSNSGKLSTDHGGKASRFSSSKCLLM